MSYLTDECIHVDVVAALRASGLDVHDIRDTHRGAVDETVRSLADAERRILITEDKDFGDLVIGRGLPVPGLVLLRLSSVDPNQKAQRLLKVLEAHADRLVGYCLVIEDAAVRIRPLFRAL